MDRIDKPVIANLDYRMLAFFVDGFVYILVGFAILKILGLQHIINKATLNYWIPIGYLPFIFRDAVNRSLGKMLFGLSIVNLQNPFQKVSVIRRVLRNITAPIYGIEAIVLLVSFFRTGNKIRFGDRLAKTMVVQSPRK